MSRQPQILIVDDDPIVADSLAEFMEHEGYTALTAGDGHDALGVIEESASNGHEPIGLVVTDLNMPRCNGIELLKTIRKKHPHLVVIVITGFGKIETAVEAVRLGASDYLTKPLVDDELRIAVGKALHQHALLAENQTLKNQLTERYGMGNIVGADYRMQKIYDLIEAVADSRTTVLIGGESGHGQVDGRSGDPRSESTVRRAVRDVPVRGDPGDAS